MGDCTGRTALWLACARACESAGPRARLRGDDGASLRGDPMCLLRLPACGGGLPDAGDASRARHRATPSARRRCWVMARADRRRRRWSGACDNEDFDGAWGRRVERRRPRHLLGTVADDWVALRRAGGAFSGARGPTPPAPSPRASATRSPRQSSPDVRAADRPTTRRAASRWWTASPRVGECSEALIARARPRTCRPSGF